MNVRTQRKNMSNLERTLFPVAGAALALSLGGLALAPGASWGADPETQKAAPVYHPISYEPGQLIKTIQRKNFLKAHRFELTAFGGGETIDPFINHWVGGLNGTYHVTEVFAFEGLLAYSPFISNIAASIFGMPITNYDLDLKDLTIELKETASVAPRSSKMRYYGHAGVVYSPLYGKFAFMSRKIVNFDIYFMSGCGFVRTTDIAADVADESQQSDTVDQTHFATNFGFGFRVAFNRWMAIRLDGREYFYIESVTAGDSPAYAEELLSLKYYFIVQTGLSFFFPTTWR